MSENAVEEPDEPTEYTSEPMDPPSGVQDPGVDEEVEDDE